MLKHCPDGFARCAACYKMDAKHKMRHLLRFRVWFCSEKCEGWWVRRNRQ